MTVQLGFKHSPISVNPLSPDIKMHILLTVLHVSYGTTL